MSIVIGFLIAAVCSWLAIYALIPAMIKLGFIDVPNERSSHSQPKPRAGGIAIIIGVSIAVIWFWIDAGSLLPWWFWASSGAVALLGILDDKFGLPVWLRLIVQVAAIALIAHFEGGITHLPLPEPLNVELGAIGLVLTFIWVLAIMNIFNFLDGVDGLAGGQTLLGAAALAAIFNGSISLFMVAMSGAALGFLLWNWDPSKVFMGDVGSSLIGFWFAIAPFFVQTIEIDTSIFIVVMVLWVFVSDGVFTIVRRALNKEKIWRPHRSHLYQRLNIAGWRHGRVVSLLITHMIVMITALFVVESDGFEDMDRWLILALGVVSFGVYAVFVRHIERNVPHN